MTDNKLQKECNMDIYIVWFIEIKLKKTASLFTKKKKKLLIEVIYLIIPDLLRWGAMVKNKLKKKQK